MAYVHTVCISTRKGTRKEQVPSVTLIENHGVAGDAHAGSERQVSLLALESIDRMREKLETLKPGDFAENLTTVGLSRHHVEVGTLLSIGPEVLLRITRIGKECHGGCDIRRTVGWCIMPKDGLFAEVLHGGEVRPGDAIRVRPEMKKEE